MGCWDWGRYLVGSLAEGRFVGVVALGRGGQPGLVSSMIWCLFGFLSLVVYLAIYFFSSFVFGSFGCGRDYGFVPCASLRYRSKPALLEVLENLLVLHIIWVSSCLLSTRSFLQCI